MVNIKIKYLRDIEKLEILSCGDWIDLRAAEIDELKRAEEAVI
jgi:hypothetical protein